MFKFQVIFSATRMSMVNHSKLSLAFFKLSNGLGCVGVLHFILAFLEIMQFSSIQEKILVENFFSKSDVI